MESLSGLEAGFRFIESPAVALDLYSILESDPSDYSFVGLLEESA